MRNILRTLDEGKIKIFDDTIKMGYPSIYEKFLEFTNPEKIIRHEQFDKHPISVTNEFVPNPTYKSPSGFIKHLKDQFDRYNNDIDYRCLIAPYGYDATKAFYVRKFMHELKDKNKRREVEEYTGCEPFYPCVMINISPSWKDQLGVITSTEDSTSSLVLHKFKRVIESYLAESNRYSKYAYCLESGSEGNFLHAHIVAEINPDLIKSVLDGKNSHINKGNHVQQIRKIWRDVFQGMPEEHALPKGAKGKYSIQRIVLRTELLKDEKLEYLHEANKPDGHKNKYDLNCLERRGL